MHHLIITADDFGLSDEVNEAVEIGHRHGVLSAASLMVGGLAAADAAQRARRLPKLRVGLHVVLVQGRPTLPPERIPDLVDGAGVLRDDLVGLAIQIVRSASLRAQMRAEIEAQFIAFLNTGIALDHVNVHKHYHLHPVVARELIAVNQRFGGAALRVPKEPGAIVQAAEHGSMSRAAASLAVLSKVLRAQATRAGLRTPDAVLGLAWSGQFTKQRLLGALQHLPKGLVEIYMHPATKDRFAGYTPGYRYSDELEALCAPEVLALMQQKRLSAGGYSDSAA